MNLQSKLLSIAVLASLSAGVAGALIYEKLVQKSQSELIKEYYDVENAVLVSPHSLRAKMDKGDTDFVLVDLRSEQEYTQEHIVGAINIPAYSDPSTSAYGDVDRIVGSFAKIPKEKNVIVYCYSIPCMTGRKIGKMLADRGIYVKHLGIGWNEWRHYWRLWNHELEWNSTQVEDYATRGSEPGEIKRRRSALNGSVCSSNGGFGC